MEMLCEVSVENMITGQINPELRKKERSQECGESLVTHRKQAINPKKLPLGENIWHMVDVPKTFKKSCGEGS